MTVILDRKSNLLTDGSDERAYYWYAYAYNDKSGLAIPYPFITV